MLLLLYSAPHVKAFPNINAKTAGVICSIFRTGRTGLFCWNDSFHCIVLEGLSIGGAEFNDLQRPRIDPYLKGFYLKLDKLPALLSLDAVEQISKIKTGIWHIIRPVLARVSLEAPAPVCWRYSHSFLGSYAIFGCSINTWRADLL